MNKKLLKRILFGLIIFINLVMSVLLSIFARSVQDLFSSFGIDELPFFTNLLINWNGLISLILLVIIGVIGYFVAFSENTQKRFKVIGLILIVFILLIQFFLLLTPYLPIYSISV